MTWPQGYGCAEVFDQRQAQSSTATRGPAAVDSGLALEAAAVAAWERGGEDSLFSPGEGGLPIHLLSGSRDGQELLDGVPGVELQDVDQHLLSAAEEREGR